MRKAFRASAALALAAMLGTAASPALAGRGWHGHGHHHRHHGHDDGFGTFLGVAALVGAVAIIASSADKNSRTARAREEQRYDGETSSGEEAAVDDCAVAAQDEGSQDGYSAEVRDINGIREVEGGWIVDGTLDQRDSYNGEVDARRFTCTWRNGRVAEVILSRDSLALR